MLVCAATGVACGTQNGSRLGSSGGSGSSAGLGSSSGSSGGSTSGAVADTTPPDPPMLSALGLSNTIVNPMLTGSAEAGTTISIYASADCSGAVTVSGPAPSGTFSLLTTGGGANTASVFTATATDAANNVSACSAPVTFANDETAPSAPMLSALGLSNVLVNPTLTGSAEGGATISIYASADCSGAVNVSGMAMNGTFALLAAGGSVNTTTTFSATATDAANNVSACASSVTFTNDESAPSAPVFAALSPALSNTIVNPTLTGTSDANETIRVYASADCSGTVNVSGLATDGSFTLLTAGGSANASETFSATATDDANNVSACASPITFTNDEAALSAPVLFAFAGPSPSTFVTVAGTSGAVGAVALIYAGADCMDVVCGTAISDQNKVFTLTGLYVDPDTTTTYSATTSDAAGNVSACSNNVVYVNDL